MPLPSSLVWSGDHLQLLDQRRLPEQIQYFRLDHWRDVQQAITSMAVRGAPAIGIAAAWGVVLAARSGNDLEEALEALRGARPTAVNLGWALDRMQQPLTARSSWTPSAWKLWRLRFRRMTGG